MNDIRYKLLLFFAVPLLFTGCAGKTAMNEVPCTVAKKEVNCGEESGMHLRSVCLRKDVVKSKKIAIFFDGTSNDASSDTNIKRLHSLVVLQGHREGVPVATSYIKGVGTGYKVVGMGTGWGIGRDVREGYEFLLHNYSQSNEIYLFGFSRGAYAARILASMLQYAGIPNLEWKGESDKIYNAKVQKLATAVYKAVKVDNVRLSDSVMQKQRVKDIQNVFDQFDLEKPKAVSVRMMGLWDTVEALGLPNYAENVDEPNRRYGDQLCNVDDVYHAVSVDDNRARIFTPILLTRKHLYKNCGMKNSQVLEHQKKHVHEVWFAGAHADVGGGYDDDIGLKGISLNWMIGNLKGTGLLPANVSVPEDIYAPSHNAERSFKAAYKKVHRDIRSYAKAYQSYTGDKILVHNSVLKRLKHMSQKSHEFNWCDDDQYKSCFENKQLRADCKLIKVVGND